MRFAFEQPYWLAALVAIPLVLLLARGWLGRAAAWRRTAALLIRTSILALLIISLARPTFFDPDEHMTVALVVDRSESMSGPVRAAADQWLQGALAELRPDDNVTMAGWGNVTSKFIAPELLLGKASDVASEVYTLGATLYALVTGRDPEQREDLRSAVPGPEDPAEPRDVLPWVAARGRQEQHPRALDGRQRQDERVERGHPRLHREPAPAHAEDGARTAHRRSPAIAASVAVAACAVRATVGTASPGGPRNLASRRCSSTAPDGPRHTR